MIESGMLEWLIDHLKQFLSQNAENISTYGLEYSTALFMNLCLHRSGKLRCLPKFFLKDIKVQQPHGR